MKQVFQSLSSGETELLELPSPKLNDNSILIASSVSLISPGTEKMLIDFGKASFLEKALKQPEKVNQVISKVKTDGIGPTIDAVKSKMEEPIALGYSNVGKVQAIGKNVQGFHVGERVVSNGPHADLVNVPCNLCAKVPDNVTDKQASFTVIASIGMQAIRLAKPSLGETFVVSGLGLIGLITAQLLKANGCNVLGLDPDISKCNIAESLGIKSLCLSNNRDAISWCLNNNNNNEVDGVLIAATTESNDPIDTAAQICRQRGRIILVGVTGLNLKRDYFYKKEITFQVSCSYGPGRYNHQYEEKGNEYPLGLVRWSLNRNFQAVLEKISNNSLNVDQLISSEFYFEDSVNAYKELTEKSSSNLGIILKYKNNIDQNQTIHIKEKFNHKDNSNKSLKSLSLSVIGAGNYAGRVLIPALNKAGANLNTITANNGIKPFLLGGKFGFKKASTDVNSTINSKESDIIVIATRHNSHGELIIKALKAGKHIFVEKPLCINNEELTQIKANYNNSRILMIGYNRRFSPLIKEMKKILDSKNSSKTYIYTCNAGSLGKEHWNNDPDIGGGRLIGEACHFVDLLRHLNGNKIKELSVKSLSNIGDKVSETYTITIEFNDGSMGTIHYLADGHNSFPKERLEVFVDNSIIQLDNFRKLNHWNSNGLQVKRSKQDKGNNQCIKEFLDSIKNGRQSPIPIDEIFEVQKYLINSIQS